MGATHAKIGDDVGHLTFQPRALAIALAHWIEVLKEERVRGRQVAAWGAGSKGNRFLNTVGADVCAIVDINPKKHGKFVAGTGQATIAPEQLADLQPSTIVIMNPAYKAEIEARLGELGLEPRLLVA